MKRIISSLAIVGLAFATSIANPVRTLAQERPQMAIGQHTPLVETSSGVRAFARNNYTLAATSDYDRYMGFGYKATLDEDYPEALAHFKKALVDRPGEYYATVAYQMVLDLLQEKNLSATSDRVSSKYDRYMKVGYQASQAKAYHFALMHFQKALNERPGDRYAKKAIANLHSYLGLNATPMIN